MFASATTTKLTNAFATGSDLGAKFRAACAVTTRPETVKRSGMTIESASLRARACGGDVALGAMANAK